MVSHSDLQAQSKIAERTTAADPMASTGGTLAALIAPNPRMIKFLHVFRKAGPPHTP
jgi:hypothetical protein